VFDEIDKACTTLTKKRKAWIKANFDHYMVRVVVSDNDFWNIYVMPNTDTLAQIIVEAMEMHFTTPITIQANEVLLNNTLIPVKRKRNDEDSNLLLVDAVTQQQQSSNSSSVQQLLATRTPHQPMINKKTGMPKEPKRKRVQETEDRCDICNIFVAAPFKHPFINGSVCRLCWEHKSEVKLVKLIVPNTADIEYVIFTCPLAAHVARVTVGERYIPENSRTQHAVQVVKECDRWRKSVYIPDEA